MTSSASTGSGRFARRVLRRGGLPVAGLALLALLLAPAAIGGDEGDAGGPTMAELQAFCRKLVTSGEITIFPFHVTAEGGIVTFDAGDVVACSQSAALCSDPVGVLVRAQCRVELLQRFVEREVKEGRTESRAFWGPTVEASEKVISAALAHVRGGRHTQGVLLRRAHMALWHVEEIFLLRLLRWADEIQAVVQTLEERGGEVADPCAPPPMPFSKLKSSPPGATIHYLSAIDWDVLTLWKKNPSESMEKSDDELLEVPAGVYVVKAVWPGGRTVGPTRLRIDGEHIMVKPTD